jgi:hypothetical protein
MRQAFVFDGVAVLVGPWHEAGDPPERGCRVEVRLLELAPPRGTRYAAERVVIDTPVFRADLFDQITAPPGNLKSAHYHPGFTGIEPVDRHWDEAIQRDPTGWLAGELAKLPDLLARSGVDVSDLAWLERDATALRDATPEITRAVQAVWDEVRSEDGSTSS